MMPSPADLESERLNALSSYDILDSLPEEDYDGITQIAAQLCGMPISTITLLDDKRQWFKSVIGLPIRQTPREDAFCAHAIQAPDQLMEVPDALADSRFIDNPLATGEPHIRFYAGVPLVDESGYALGTLCVIDTKPNKLTDKQATALKLLARQVVVLLKLRRSQLLLAETNQTLQVTNEELQESNQLLKVIVDNCPVGLVFWQAIREQGRITDLQYIFTNPFNAQVTGLSVAQMTGNTLKNLFPNAGSSNIVQRFTTAIETGQNQHYQQYDRFDQIDMWGDYLLVPLGDRALLAYRDISQLKKNEDQLLAYSQNLEQLVSERMTEISQLSALQNAILEHAGLAIISTDATGVIRTVNPATRHLLGYGDNELIGKRDATFLYDPVELEARAQVLSSRLGRSVQVGFDLFKLMLNNRGYECTMISKEGRRIPTLLITTTLLDADETIIGYVVMATDITALKTTRTELQQRNQELNTFFEVALDLHCIADTTGKILKTNRAWQTTLGYTADELSAINHFDLVHPHDRAATRSVVGQTTSAHNNMSHINRFRRRDGIYRVIEWNVVAIDNLLYASARDITERQQVEKQLKSLNQRLQLATRAAGQGIWEYDLKQDLMTWDKQMYAIHGLAQADRQLHLRDYQQLIHPDDLVRFAHRRDSGSDTFTTERRIIQPDGTVRYTELNGIRTRNKAGLPTGSVGVVRDITDRKQAEFALLQSGERYRSLVDNLKVVVYQTNLKGEWTFLNPFWTTMTGYSMDESLGKPFSDCIAPQDRQKSREVYREFVTLRKTAVRLLICYQHKNGKTRWAEAFPQLLTDDAGRPVGTTGTIMDITDRKQVQDALRQSEQRFRDIAENINEIFWIHSAQPLQLLYINPAYELITGLSSAPLYSNPMAFLDVVLEEDRPLLNVAFEQYVQGQEISVQCRAKNATGDIRWFAIRTFVKKNSNGLPISYVGLSTDVTNQKEKELVLQQSLEREQELNRLKSQFVATASHEFRTPLATIQSSVDLIKLYSDQSTTGQPAIQRHLGVIEKEVANFGQLLGDILTFGKIEAGKVRFSPQWIDLPLLVDQIIATHFDHRTDSRTVRLATSGASRPIYADDKLIAHALVNLLSNAFKFSTENPKLHIDFTEDTVLLRVSDTGIGIPADDLAHLFETFFRARNAVNIQGSGMGLVISRQFIEQHGGQLDVQSQENRGTTCTITLPG